MSGDSASAHSDRQTSASRRSPGAWPGTLRDHQIKQYSVSRIDAKSSQTASFQIAAQAVTTMGFYGAIMRLSNGAPTSVQRVQIPRRSAPIISSSDRFHIHSQANTFYSASSNFLLF